MKDVVYFKLINFLWFFKGISLLLNIGDHNTTTQDFQININLITTENDLNLFPYDMTKNLSM